MFISLLQFYNIIFYKISDYTIITNNNTDIKRRYLRGYTDELFSPVKSRLGVCLLNGTIIVNYNENQTTSVTYLPTIHNNNTDYNALYCVLAIMIFICCYIASCIRNNNTNNTKNNYFCKL